jgi:hypothetical protein
LPDIIDNCGFILERRDLDKLKKLFSRAIACDKKDLSEKARQRIIDNFPQNIRESKLLELAAALMT